MKKLISATLIIILLISIIPISTVAATNFTDVPKDAFYKADLDFITNDPRHILEGYKGKFNPEGGLSVAQFIKIAVAASNKLVAGLQKNEKWYGPYVSKAIEMGYVHIGEFTDYERTITRGEMARILIRTVENVTGIPQYRDPDKVKVLIKDYNILPSNLKDYIVKTYDAGLIGGYSNGKFAPNDKFTRGQAVVVVRRLLDPSKRIKVDLDKYVEQATKVYDGISFNPYTDTTGKAGDMKIDKAQEFAIKLYNSLQFYEKDDKAYAKGYIPIVPEGYSLSFSIDINVMDHPISIATDTYIENNKLPRQGNFDKYLNKNKVDIKQMWITVVISELDSKNIPSDDGSFTLYYPEKSLEKITFHKPTVTLPLPEGVFKEW